MQSLKALEEFANFAGYEPLSAADINNLKLVVQISTLVRESVVVPPINVGTPSSLSPPEDVTEP
jgi:hypothetical protein